LSNISLFDHDTFMTTRPANQSQSAAHPIMNLRLLWSLLALSTLHIITTTAAATLLESVPKEQDPRSKPSPPNNARKIEPNESKNEPKKPDPDTSPKQKAPSSPSPPSAVPDAVDVSKQKLTVIAYASDGHPARHLVSFANRFDLDFHLIGVNKPWGGFNDKITGFSSFIHSIENADNSSIVLVLDAYDTVPICNAQDFLTKFNSMNADIVISTGADCWPDPNVESFLLDRIDDEMMESHPFFPWFLCPNSGAIMGRHDAMLAMFKRVHELVKIGNGSCSDFEGHNFGISVQSDQRCYTTYYTENLRWHEMMAANNGDEKGDVEEEEGVIDIGKLNEDSSGALTSSLSTWDTPENHKYYSGVKMVLDHDNELFLSTGGMLFMNIDIDIEQNGDISMRNKITNGSFCVLHGNGPGVILWRSFVKQMKHNGKLFVDDYILRVGSDFFHWMLWWAVMPCERLSHYVSVTYNIEPFQFHSTTFGHDLVWSFHIWSLLIIIGAFGIPIGYWYKYKFRKTMKRRRRRGKHHHDGGGSRGHDDDDDAERKIKGKNRKPLNHILNHNHPITKAINRGLVNLEIMVHHDGNRSSLPLFGKPRRE